MDSKMVLNHKIGLVEPYNFNIYHIYILLYHYLDKFN